MVDIATTQVLPDLITGSRSHGVAVVGETGSGKTLVVRHLVDQYLLRHDQARLFSIQPCDRRRRSAARYECLGMSAAIVEPGNIIGDHRVTILVTRVYPAEESAGFLTAIHPIAKEGDLVVVDELPPEKSVRQRVQSLIIGLVAKGVRVVVVAQRAQHLPDCLITTDSHEPPLLELIWTRGNEFFEQKELVVRRGEFADLMVGAMMFRYAASPTAYWWHTSHPKDLARLAAIGGEEAEAVVALVQLGSERC